MHYPNIDPGPATGHSTPEIETINLRLRGGAVKVSYFLEDRENECGCWCEPVIHGVIWAFDKDHDVHDLTRLERDELKEQIMEVL